MARWGVVAAALLVAGCSALPWSVRPSEPSLEAALSSSRGTAVPPGQIAELPTPAHLRRTTAEAAGGEHLYDGGAISLAGGGDRVDPEAVGFVYTCRGGLIDLARVRDAADLTVFLAGAVARRQDRGGAIALADLGGVRYVTLAPLDVSALRSRSAREIAIDTATWAAFQCSIWRAIFAVYGRDPKVDDGPASANPAPENLYSDLLGIRLARGLLLAAPRLSGQRQYERRIDAWIDAALEYLGEVPPAATKSARRLIPSPGPGAYLLGPRLEPATVPAEALAEPPLDICAGALPLPLDWPWPAATVPKGVAVEVEVDDAVGDRDFPFPRDDSNFVKHDDLPGIAARLRADLGSNLGSAPPASPQPPATRPQ